MARVPEVLVLHLNRFHSGFFQTKTHTLVRFPASLSIQEHFCHTAQYTLQDTDYTLYAVVEHQGQVGIALYYTTTMTVGVQGRGKGGHFVTYSRHIRSGQWYEYNDAVVRKVTLSFVLAREAYMLFYARRSDLSAVSAVRETLMAYAIDQGTSLEITNPASCGGVNRDTPDTPRGAKARFSPKLLRYDCTILSTQSKHSSRRATTLRKMLKREPRRRRDHTGVPRLLLSQQHSPRSFTKKENDVVFVSRQWAAQVMHHSHAGLPCNYDIACMHGR
jgi:hypothetical protein